MRVNRMHIMKEELFIMSRIPFSFLQERVSAIGVGIS
jgi:hypothetical protein